MGEGGYKQINKTLDISAFNDYLEAQQSQLPKLADIQQLSPRVIRVLGQNPGKFTLQGTNTYIVGTGPKRLIIDTAQGFPEWADLIKTTLDRSQTALSHILLTHWHGDHTGGVPDLLRLYPSLTNSVYKHQPTASQTPISDNQQFTVEGATLRAIHGKGHSDDHMCFVLEEENALFTGDNLLGHGTSAVEHLGVYMGTLERLKAQGCQVGYPAHGDVIADVGCKIDAELAAKIRREEKCLAALRELKGGGMGPPTAGRGAGATVKELVVVMHGDRVDERVREKALEPFVDEVLKKLAEDGKVAFFVRGGRRRWFCI